jgi:hypothetical protein
MRAMAPGKVVLREVPGVSEVILSYPGPGAVGQVVP